MATADFSSEETFVIKCTFLCGKNALVNEAVKACQDCKKYLCSSCFDVHNNIFDGHNIVQPPDLCFSLPMPFPTEQCKKHIGKAIDVWCVQHDVVGCVSCALFEHRSCESLKDIPSEIKDIFKQEDFDSVKTELNSCLDFLKERQCFINGQKEQLLVEKNAQLSKIEQYTKKLISMVKVLEKNSKDELQAKFIEVEKEIKKVADDCKHYEEDIRQCLLQIDSSSRNKTQMFITMKNAKLTIALVDKNCRNSDIGDHTVIYRPFSNIEEQIDTFKSMGSCSKVLRKSVIELKLKQEINIKMPDDFESCQIEGSCVIPGGSVVVADKGNKKLKHIDLRSSSVIASCPVRGDPRGVCCVGQQEVILALVDKKLQFYSVRKRLSLCRTINVDHVCYGIDYHNGQLFVSDGSKSIYVYNLQGSCIRRLSNTESLYVAVSRDGEKIFSSCASRYVVCTDRLGNHIYKKEYSNFGSCRGICLDNTSSVFVSGLLSNNVIQLSESGEELGEVLNQSDGVFLPRSLCYDTNQQRLIVSQCSNTVLVFQVEYPH